jgi:hypothetical protein
LNQRKRRIAAIWNSGRFHRTSSINPDFVDLLRAFVDADVVF